MNVSLRWLNEYTKVSAPDAEIAHRLNMTGTEIKGFFRPAGKINRVVVCKILSVEPHPDADRLCVCQVDIGENEPLQIVTAAKNMKVGDLVPVALHKSNLYDGTQITKGKLRGVSSNGMFCGADELGLSVNDYPDAVSDGLLILKEGTPGQDILENLGLNDTIFEADIMTNRPDCLSIIGVAREAAGTFGQEFRVPAPVVKGEGRKTEDFVSVSVSAPDLCPRYMARAVENVKIAPSPLWMVEKLRSCGIRSINNIVDITNLVMMEYGQPMHAFDYSRLAGGKINVRRAAKDEPMTTLDGEDHVLNEEMLVIADGEKPVALAGVMGGLNSEITDTTSTVIFESANFVGANIRHTARALGMRTESSAHFEKNLDVELTVQALDRACALVEELGAGTVASTVIDVDNHAASPRVIDLSADWIRHYVALPTTDAEMKTILERIGFSVDLSAGTVTVPSWRSDVENKYDLAEEIARFYGYDEIPSEPFTASIRSGGLTKEQQFEKSLRADLRAVGFSEIETYSFVSPKGCDKIRLAADDSLRNMLIIKNPLGEDTSAMRTSALPSMLEILSSNYRNRIPSARLYEVATVYLKNADETKLPDEPKIVTVGAYGEIDFYAMKGRLEELFSALRFRPVSFRPLKTNPSYHPGRCAEILCGGKVIGVFGQLHPVVVKNYGMSGEVYAAQLPLQGLFESVETASGYAPLPKFPAVSRDLALVCDETMLSGDVEAKIRQLGGETLEDIRVFDVYRSEALGNRKSIAYSLSFRDNTRTLTDADIDPLIARIVEGLAEDNVTLRQ